MAHNDRNAQVALNQKHLQDPQPGDYWEDHMVGALQVVTVTHSIVVFFDEKKSVDDMSWAWDMTKPKALPIADFAKRLRYKSPTMDNKTWADVHPNREL
jgi:hypothetical protein